MNPQNCTGSPRFWHRAVDVLFDATILGGIMAMPVAAVVAMMSIFLAALAPLRPLEGQVFAIASLWFVTAVLGAHLRVRGDKADGAR